MKSSHGSNSGNDRPQVIVLQKYAANGLEWQKSMTTLLNFYSWPDLVYKEYNTPVDPKKTEGFKVLQAARALREEEDAKAEEADGNSLQREEDELPSIVNAEKLVPEYRSPTTGKTESAEKRKLRMKIWAAVESTLTPFHQHIVQRTPLGNVGLLIQRGTRAAGNFGDKAAINALFNLMALKKTARMPFSDYEAVIHESVRVLRQQGNSTLYLPEHFLSILVLRAAGHDAQYEQTCELLHRVRPFPQVADVLARLAEKAARIEAGQKPRPVSANVARHDRDPPKKSKNPCWDFMKRGECKRGDKCRFKHDPKQSRPGKCPECGGKHDLKECDRHKQMEELKAHNASLKRRLEEATSTQLEEQPKKIKTQPETLSGHSARVPDSEGREMLGTFDSGLMNLFRS